MQTTCPRSLKPILGLLLASAGALQAQFAPIPLTPSSYTQDMVVEVPNVVTTATMDNGPENTGATWYEIGYYSGDTGGTGLPSPGTVIVSSSASDHSYQFAPDYTTNNAILIDPTVTNATITLSSPSAFTGLSFLLAAGNGAETIQVKVHHADLTVETNTITAPDWFNNSPVAYTANGRVDVQGRVPDSVSSGNPRMYSADITLTDTGSPVTSVTFARTGSGGHGAIFAISGTTGSGFNPITFTGYNEDMIVEQAAQYLPPSQLFTTASMDTGTGNTGDTWYVRGFDTAAGATNTGLPPAGSTIASAAALDHQYTFAPSYSSNNVLLIDSGDGGSLTWATPKAHSALSFLVSAGHGPILVDYTVVHEDNNVDQGVLTIPDWFNNTPVAYNANGRVDASTGVFDSVSAGNPRLYTVDVSLNDTTSPVTTVQFGFDGANTNAGLAVIFAVSGTGGAIAPVIATEPVSTNALLASLTSLSVAISGTAPLTNHWQISTGGSFSNMTNVGEITGVTTTNLTFTNLAFSDAADYQLVVSNSVGAVTSSIAHINVISTNVPVTASSDPISIYNGTSPAAEQVVEAIDATTSKYLNFGVSNATQTPPYVGPTGLVVTPAMGSTVLTGMRLFTANDSPERDPADYLIEGSTNGGSTYTTIASGTISMPTDRNAAGQSLNAITEFNREVHFANSKAYTTYRWSVNNVRSDTSANSMQVGEVQLLGTKPSATVTLTYTVLSASQIQFSWAHGVSLQSAPNAVGTYTNIPAASNSPYTVTITPGSQFFRVKVQ